ncbi:MAG TPA: hypothetical protein VMH80_19975 [Bryobacteraceae bacterium]|nr:hypothetical protein [Bryobacteraceae bacterium]
MSKLQMKVALLAGLGALALLPGAKADPYNQKTVFTFGGAVEVPGQVLPAGTYVFKLLDSPSNRHIVQIFNQEENQVLGTFLAIPDYRLQPAEKTIITFHERPAGSPEAVKAWFYPGRNHGHEFVYPKQEAVALAKANNTPVPAMPEELAVNTTKPAVTMTSPEVAALEEAPLVAEEPSGEEVEIAAAFPDSPQAAEPHAAAVLPEELPSTGSPLPLIGVLGALSMGTAAALRFSAAKAK